MKMKSRHESCYNVADKRNKNCSKNNCSIWKTVLLTILVGRLVPRAKVEFFFKECVTRHVNYS